MKEAMNVELIKNTGVQFVDIKLVLDEERTGRVSELYLDRKKTEVGDNDEYEVVGIYDWKKVDMHINVMSINENAFSPFDGKLDESLIQESFVESFDPNECYRIRGHEVLPLLEDHWLPLPYFRRRNNDRINSFHNGPQDWVRCILRKDTSRSHFSHILTIAIDTTTNELQSGGEYLQPRESDASDSGNERYGLCSDFRLLCKFLHTGKVVDWMYNLYCVFESSKYQKIKLWEISAYHTFLKLLSSTNALPDFRLLAGDRSIDVGLILDIGNSRTCGILCEKNRPYDNNPFDFTKARRLKIRSFYKPSEFTDEPFEMQVTFSEERFGNTAVDFFPDVFNWPSLVRVGAEAIDLASVFESQDAQATMSSPKRYLWDTRPVNVPWIKVNKDGLMGYTKDSGIKRNALFGIAEFLTSVGELTDSSRRNQTVLTATESRYSRSSVMMLAIYEIILHALTQMNSQEFREDQGNSSYRRVLKDVVITCPTAMTLQEQYHLRKAVYNALQLIKKNNALATTISPNVKLTPPIPDKDPSNKELNFWKFDEALCSQFAYLYGEIVHKFNREADVFFDLKGKSILQDSSSSKNRSMVVASVDIGGGTTDLMIANYELDSNAEIPLVVPKPLFWEGFNLAGDDIVKRVIEFILIPQLHEELKSKQAQDVTKTLNRLFGPNIGNQSAQERIYRRQFANQIAAPLVYEVLDYAIKSEKGMVRLTISELFEKYPKPTNGLLEHINNTMHKFTGVETFDIEQVQFTVDATTVNLAASDVMSNVLKQMTYLIGKFDCDIVLLSGRPSRLPIVQSIIMSYFAFSPHKVVRLGGYRFGAWYPFADPNGQVSDPKSTVSVGALIAYLNSEQLLPAMRFDNRYLTNIDSTSRYIGLLDNLGDKINSAHVLVSPSSNKGKFKFYGDPVILGMRQLKEENWIATPLYIFEFNTDEEKELLLGRGLSFPLDVSITRYGETGEFLSDDDLQITDAQGNLVENKFFNFTLCTSKRGEEFWRDSGSFIIGVSEN